MKRWVPALLVVLSLGLATAAACGTEGSTHDVSPPPRYSLGSGATAIIPDARGRAEVLVPEGDVLLAFVPSTSTEGSYSFALDGTSAAGAAYAAPITLDESAVTAARGDVEPASLQTTVLPSSSAALPDSRRFAAPAGRDKSGSLTIDAVKVVEGERVVFYSEEPNSMVTEIAQEIVDYFDRVVFPESTLLFGPIPDVDGNGKVILLATSAVNNYSSVPGQFTGGFFASRDLIGREDSNHADMLYLYLPQPRSEGGVYDHAEEYARLMKEVIVHELQHMINYGERLNRGGRLETAWLNEGLSHWAEDHFGFQRSNRIRAGQFLASPHTTPLVGKCSSLAERGAAYLFVKYLVENSGDPQILRKLVGTARRGTDNVANATRRPFGVVLREWMSFLYAAHPEVKTVALDKYSARASLPQSAPAFFKVRGPGVLKLNAAPKGSFQGVGVVLPAEG